MSLSERVSNFFRPAIAPRVPAGRPAPRPTPAASGSGGPDPKYSAGSVRLAELLMLAAILAGCSDDPLNPSSFDGSVTFTDARVPGVDNQIFLDLDDAGRGPVLPEGVFLPLTVGNGEGQFHFFQGTGTVVALTPPMRGSDLIALARRGHALAVFLALDPRRSLGVFEDRACVDGLVDTRLTTDVQRELGLGCPTDPNYVACFNDAANRIPVGLLTLRGLTTITYRGDQRVPFGHFERQANNANPDGGAPIPTFLRLGANCGTAAAPLVTIVDPAAIATPGELEFQLELRLVADARAAQASSLGSHYQTGLVVRFGLVPVDQ